MVALTDWKPSPGDVAWLKNLLRTIAEGGVWACPAGQTIFQVSHASKTLKANKIPGMESDPDFIKRTILVAAEFGWKVVLE